MYDPDDILSISRFCYSFHVTRDFLPEIVRKHIGSFRTESHLKVNRENNHKIKNTNIVERTNNSTSNNVITVNVGTQSTKEKEDGDTSDGTEKDDDMDTNSLASPNGETPRKVGRLTIDIPSGTPSQRQSRYGRNLKPNIAKPFQAEFQGAQDEIIVQIGSDNEYDDVEVQTQESNKKDDDTRVVAVATTSRNKFGTGKLNCKYCDRRYHHLKARNKHMISEHIERCRKDGYVFQCELCSTNFVSAIGKLKHMRRVHNRSEEDLRGDEGEEKRDCLNHCPFEDDNTIVEFANIKDLKVHIKQEHPEKDKSCIGCGQNCDTRENLIKHIQVHETGSFEARNLYSCEHCHQKFLSEYVMLTHKRNKHSLCETLSCEICGKEFKNSKFLSNHLEKHRKEDIDGLQPEEEEFCCELPIPEKGNVTCGKTFKLKCNLERHIKTSHMQIKLHQCNDCGKKFVDSTRLKEHRWIHTDHRPIKCKLCDKGFRHQNHLRHHMAKIHGKDKEFSCTICPKKFVYNYQLKTHILTHSQSKTRPQRGIDKPQVDVPMNEPTLLIDMNTGVVQGGATAEGDSDPYVQTLYQCSLCQQVFDTYRALQAHCLQHTQTNVTGATEDNDRKPSLNVDRPIDITLVSDNPLGSQLGLNSGSTSDKPHQILLEISSEHSDNNKPSSSSRGVNLPLESLEGRIIKEQDGQQYYVVYDVPASQPIIEFEK